MKRRDFLSKGVAAGIAATSIAPLASLAEDNEKGTSRFKLKYAPHFNMFKSLSGTDLIDQMKYDKHSFLSMKIVLILTLISSCLQFNQIFAHLQIYE